MIAVKNNVIGSRFLKSGLSNFLNTQSDKVCKNAVS